MEDKMVTIYIGGYPRRCPESRVPLILENIEKIKQYYAEKGAPKDMVEAAASYIFLSLPVPPWSI